MGCLVVEQLYYIFGGKIWSQKTMKYHCERKRALLSEFICFISVWLYTIIYILKFTAWHKPLILLNIWGRKVSGRKLKAAFLNGLFQDPVSITICADSAQLFNQIVSVNHFEKGWKNDEKTNLTTSNYWAVNLLHTCCTFGSYSKVQHVWRRLTAQ